MYVADPTISRGLCAVLGVTVRPYHDSSMQAAAALLLNQRAVRSLTRLLHKHFRPSVKTDG